MINVKKWVVEHYDRFNVKYLVLLVLATLHYERKISDEKLKGQFQALRSGTLLKRKGTYHCKINDHWYNDEKIEDIFKEIAEDKWVSNIPLEVFLGYIQKFENKNYNYALNIFGSEYLYPLFRTWNPEYHSTSFNEYIDLDFTYISASDNSHTCYECGHRHHHVYKNDGENLKRINEWLHSKKKGNLKKIPVHKIEKNAGLGSWYW